METEELTPAMQELMARMSSMQTELIELKTRASVLSQPDLVKHLPLQPAITTTRRKTLRRLCLALLGGVTTATALGEASTVQAKVSANPQGSLTNKAGMLVLPPGSAAPVNSLGNFIYGLIASGNTTALNLASFPTSNTGLLGFGSYGVYGGGSEYGIVGFGAGADSTGVYGQGKIGVRASGQNGGGLFKGNGYGVGASVGSADIGNQFSTNTMVGLVATSGVSLDLSAEFAPNQSVGLFATASNLFGLNPTAGYFKGNVNVTGIVSKSSGTFKIDHPLDPENKYLYHSFVESPDMLNIYNGIAILDAEGSATVKMPDWFEALNRDFRYQLTSIGVAGPNLYISQKITKLEFKIAGGQPGQEVSWMITGIRQDEWAKAHPIQVEEGKTGDARGKYLHPEVFGKPDALRVGLQ